MPRTMSLYFSFQSPPFAIDDNRREQRPCHGTLIKKSLRSAKKTIVAGPSDEARLTDIRQLPNCRPTLPHDAQLCEIGERTNECGRATSRRRASARIRRPLAAASGIRLQMFLVQRMLRSKDLMKGYFRLGVSTYVLGFVPGAGRGEIL